MSVAAQPGVHGEDAGVPARGGRHLGALLPEENGLKNVLKKTKKKEGKTHSSVVKYCLVVLSLALGPDCLSLILGSSAF